MKRIGVMVLAVLLSAASVFAFAGCNNNTVAQDGKFHIRVRYTSGGLGDDWMNKIIDDFEEAYKDYSFDGGQTTGITVDPNFLKENPQVNTVKSSLDNVYVIENANYNQWITADAAADITDIVTTGAKSSPAQSETTSIASKMLDDYDNYYNVGTESEPQYYGLPYFRNTMNINYNIDLFESGGYYFKAGASADSLTEEQRNNATAVRDLFILDDKEAERSLGPDGKTGVDETTGYDYSADDGLPATYADFEALLTMLRYEGITPFIWNIKATSYLRKMTKEIWAHNQGAAEFKVNLTWTGESEGEQITPATAYKLQKQSGKQEAFDFVKMIVKNSNNYYTDGFTGSFTHLDAQRLFIKGGYEDGYDTQFAFLIDGMWWMNEGKSNFADDNDYKTRNYGILPLPWASAEDAGTKRNTTVDEGSAIIFINSNVEGNDALLNACKTFVSFMHTEQSLNTFSAYTNLARPFDYTLTAETEGRMSTFGKAVWNHLHAPDTDAVAWLPQSEATENNIAILDVAEYGFRNDDNYSTNAFEALRTTSSSDLSAADYFDAIYNYYSGNWNTLYRG